MNPTTGLPVNAALQQAVLLVARGNALQKAGDRNGAAQAYQQAIRLAPLNAAAYRALLELLVHAGDTANAQLVMRAVPPVVHQQSAAIRFIHARLLLQEEQPEEALALLQALAGSTEVEPATLAFNLALCHTLTGKHAESLPFYEQARKLGLHTPPLYLNWARSTLFSGNPDDAERIYREAARAWPNEVIFKYEHATLLLKTGHYDLGFRLFHHRWHAGLPQFQVPPGREISLPTWDGRKPLRSLLVTREQGIGEQIVFSALLPALARKVDHLAVSFDTRLYPLIRRTWPDIECAAPDEALDSVRGRFDAWLSSGDIGAVVPDALGWKDGYLAPDLGRTAQLREKYQRQFPGKKLVGVSWTSRESALSKFKTMNPLDWKPIFEVPDCQFINLQYGDVRADLARVREVLGVDIHQDPEIDAWHDLDGLAAQMAALDLVITSSNSTAHIAAGTRAPTWIILPSTWGLLWYWGYKDNRCDWYPEARLFRAEGEGDWNPILAEVAAALQQGCRART
ncbi:MAG: hypothetical protein K0Q68_1020 [Moraxellaceae bacterium]|jgi:tetratricopeptide (TPR) repeat protein|nr:hypothetical protein [Moraxellaceae bacterium]